MDDVVVSHSLATHKKFFLRRNSPQICYLRDRQGRPHLGYKDLSSFRSGYLFILKLSTQTLRLLFYSLHI